MSNGNDKFNTSVEFARRTIQKFHDTITKDGVKVVGISVDGTFTGLATEATAVLSVWDSITGNSRAFTYYTGVEAGNPSGNKNVKTIAYKTGGVTLFTRTLTFDADDDVLTITAS